MSTDIRLPLDPDTDPSIDSKVKAFLHALNNSGGEPLETLSPVDARGVLTGAQESVTVDISGVEFSEKTITSEGLTVKLDIVRPAGVSGKLPVFMFFHGGGWVLGDFPTHKRLVRDLVVASGAVAVFPNYTPAPEAKYPTQINEAYAATKWVAEHGDEIGVDGKNLALAGNSVGGNMTAVVSILAKEKQGPAIKGQILLWPVTNADFDNGSYNEFATGRFLTKNMMIWFFDNYATLQQRSDIHISPLQATTEQLKGLPPALVLVAENDVLRDEGEAYARKLDQAGVPVTLVRYQGMIHDWGLLNPLATVPGTQSAMAHAGAELKKYLR
ncbi:alpha/beta hydrolase [Chitinophaga rhizophila]|uniref:Alpha/beta hydrolase n=1 Tax=Chitinophaga rhizophila TaxID=2866212 RepID=A0ABS7G6X0_9BACT|nr:alpha/beta hydrolase [Chitinophaga rhizophila]MBW8683196.1 alpha/beta hydrolase [Chitinophaga rhizophila]